MFEALAVGSRQAKEIENVVIYCLMWLPAVCLLLNFALSAVQIALKTHPGDARLLSIQGIALAQMGDQTAALPWAVTPVTPSPVLRLTEGGL